MVNCDSHLWGDVTATLSDSHPWGDRHLIDSHLWGDTPMMELSLSKWNHHHN